jgi:acetyltransferase
MDRQQAIIRPVRLEDAAAEGRFFSRLSPCTRRLRFHDPGDALSDGLIHFYTHVDQDRHAAFVCEHGGEIVGEARYVANPDGRSCELGIVVADDWHHTGIAQRLMGALIDAARARGFRTLEGLVLSENTDMLDFVKSLGFEVEPMREHPATMRVVKRL